MLNTTKITSAFNTRHNASVVYATVMGYLVSKDKKKEKSKAILVLISVGS
jgi:hypothetical protein